MCPRERGEPAHLAPGLEKQNSCRGERGEPALPAHLAHPRERGEPARLAPVIRPRERGEPAFLAPVARPRERGERAQVAALKCFGPRERDGNIDT